jgi:DNA polymerase-3 subunit epsilon
MTDTHWKNRTLAVLDVETTGLDPQNDRVIEVGIVRFEKGEVVERYGQLIQPGRDIPEEVSKITGIQGNDLEGQPSFEQVAQDVCGRLEGAIVVGYNLPFDRAFVTQELNRCGYSWPDTQELDPLVFVRQLHKGQGSKKLGAACARMGIDLENAHRAADDADATGKLLLALAEQLPDSMEDLLTLQGQWEVLQEQERAKWRRSKEEEKGGVDPFKTRASNAPMTDAEGRYSLGPAYIYGDDTDPIRALFSNLPDVGSRR